MIDDPLSNKDKPSGTNASFQELASSINLFKLYIWSQDKSNK